MKATTEYVTRIELDGSFIKVILSYDHNIYKYKHKGIHFFIHMDHWSGLWNAIEERSGSSIVAGYYPKKECLKYALLCIDNIIDLDKVIEHNIELTRFAKIVNMDEYLEIES